MLAAAILNKRHGSCTHHFPLQPTGQNEPMGIPGSNRNWEIMSLAVVCPGKGGENNCRDNWPSGICHILFSDARGEYIAMKFCMISLLID